MQYELSHRHGNSLQKFKVGFCLNTHLQYAAKVNVLVTAVNVSFTDI